MNSDPLLLLGLLMTSGLLFSMLFGKLGIPRVAAYALAGLIWSPDLIGQWLQNIDTSWTSHLTDVALAIVAYIIGGSMTVNQLRKLGRSIVFVTFGQVFGALIIVCLLSGVLLGISGNSLGWVFALALGVLATSTDPAATVAVIHQYRSQGKLTTTLLGIAALDDAIGIILFSLLIVFISGSDMTGQALNAGIEIIGAMLLGALMGYILALIGHRVKNTRFFLPMVLAALFLSQGLADIWHLSPLLTAMSMGFIARATYVSGGERLFASVEYLEELVFLVFFTLAGTHFNFHIFWSAIDIVLVYVTARIIGKVLGSGIAGQLASAPKVITQYAGLGAIPQAGIAIGMALTLLEYGQFAEQGVVLLNVILASTLIFELIGPFAARQALQKAGEISLDSKHD